MLSGQSAGGCPCPLMFQSRQPPPGQLRSVEIYEQKWAGGYRVDAGLGSARPLTILGLPRQALVSRNMALNLSGLPSAATGSWLPGRLLDLPEMVGYCLSNRAALVERGHSVGKYCSPLWECPPPGAPTALHTWPLPTVKKVSVTEPYPVLLGLTITVCQTRSKACCTHPLIHLTLCSTVVWALLLCPFHR